MDVDMMLWQEKAVLEQTVLSLVLLLELISPRRLRLRLSPCLSLSY